MGNSLEDKFEHCKKQSASYSIGYYKDIIDLISKYRLWLNRYSTKTEVKLTEYKDSSMDIPKSIMTVFFQLPVSNKDKKYDIECQIIFPPNFPKVPPILALNYPDLSLMTAEFYSKFPLPTNSFEVKVLNYKYTTKPEDLLNEFSEKIQVDFPFYKKTKGKKIEYKFPKEFDLRYNNESTIFPFDFPFSDDFRLKEQMKTIKTVKNEYQRDVELLKETFQQFQSQMSSKVKLNLLYSEKSTELNKDAIILKEKNVELENKINKYKDIEFLNLIEKSNSEPEFVSIQIECEILAIQEMILFIEESYFENENIDFEKMDKKLDSLYKREFELRLNQIVHFLY